MNWTPTPSLSEIVINHQIPDGQRAWVRLRVLNNGQSKTVTTSGSFKLVTFPVLYTGSQHNYFKVLRGYKINGKYHSLIGNTLLKSSGQKPEAKLKKELHTLKRRKAALLCEHVKLQGNTKKIIFKKKKKRFLMLNANEMKIAIFEVTFSEVNEPSKSYFPPVDMQTDGVAAFAPGRRQLWTGSWYCVGTAV